MPPRRPIRAGRNAHLIEEVIKSGAADGYPLTRILAHMEWAVSNKQGVEDLVEYETRVNYVLSNTSLQ